MRMRVAAWLFAALGLVSGPGAQAAYSSLFVLGDSLSDSGNNALAIGIDAAQVVAGNTYVPTHPYASGHYSNGAVWAQIFAASLGLSAQPSLAGGTNFASGGARIAFDDPATGGFPPSLKTQANRLLTATGGTAPGSALYVVAGGGNDARDVLAAIGGGADPTLTIGQAALDYADNVGDIVDQLQAAGAHDIVVWNTPNLGLAPAVLAGGAGASFLGTALTGTMNAALAARLGSEADVRTFDLFGLLTSISVDPAAFGLVNATDACGASALCNPSTSLFWDGIHPTSAGHRILAQAMFATVVPEPASAALLLAGLLLLICLSHRHRA